LGGKCRVRQTSGKPHSGETKNFGLGGGTERITRVKNFGN